MSTIRLRRGTDAAWAAANPVLLSGEPGVAIDTGVLKIGNGTDAWADLDAISDGLADPATQAAPTSVLSLGVKGDVLTITDAAITSGQNTLSRSGTTKFSSADVGKYVQVVGAGAPFNNRGAWAPSTAYAFGDLVTYLGNTYIAAAAIAGSTTFNTSGWSKSPANSQTLMASISSVTGGVATLSSNAGTTVSGATCVYGTDDSSVLNALPSGDYYFPGNRTYFVADWFVASDTNIFIGAKTTFKIPRYATTDVRVFGLLTTNASSYVENIHIHGTVRIDCSELTQPVVGTVPRGVHVLNCRDWSIERVIGVNLPGATGNAMQVGTNGSGQGARRGKVGSIHNRGVRGDGSSAVQHTSGTDIEYGVLTSDGGLAFRCEMDSNPSGVLTENVRVRLASASGVSGFPIASVYFSPHNNTVRNVEVGTVLAEGGADGALFEYASSGSISDITVQRMRVTGGGAGVATSQNDRVFPGVSIRDAHVDGAVLAPALRNTGGRLPGVGFAVADGMRYTNARATNCASNGFKDIFSTTGVVAASRATLIGCEAVSNVGAGAEFRALEKVTIIGGKYADNPAYATPTTAQKLPSNAYTGTLAGWATGTGASGATGSGGTLTVTASGVGDNALVHTATGTSAVAVTAGHFYKVVATAALGTAPSGAGVNSALWWYDSSGAFLSANYGSVVNIASGTATTSVSAVAPAGAAFAAYIIQAFSNVVGGTLTSGWTWTFSGIAMQEIPGIATQTYGLQADAGVTIEHAGVSFIANGIASTSGAGTVTNLGSGGDPAGTAAAAVSAHVAATDPHGDRAYTDTQLSNAKAAIRNAGAATMTRRESNVALSGFGSGIIVAGLVTNQVAQTYTKARVFFTGAGAALTGVKIGLWAADGSSLITDTADFSGSVVANTWVTVTLTAAQALAVGQQVMLGIAETHTTTSIGIRGLGPQVATFWSQTAGDGPIDYRGRNSGTWAGGSNALPAAVQLGGGPGIIPLIELVP